MALIACPKCQGKVSTKAQNCPHCGAGIADSPEPPLASSVPPKIILNCPKCGKEHRYPTSAAGRKGRCDACGSPYRIAAPETKDSSPAGVDTAPGASAASPSRLLECVCGRQYRVRAGASPAPTKCPACGGPLRPATDVEQSPPVVATPELPKESEEPAPMRPDPPRPSPPVPAIPDQGSRDVFDLGRTVPGSAPSQRSPESPPPARTSDPFDIGRTTPNRAPSQGPQATSDPGGKNGAPAPTAEVGELANGTTLRDRYTIIKKLGRGGMGIVYKAADRETGTEYAIKVVAPELASNPSTLAALRKEAARAQSLTHQNLMKVNILETSGAVVFIVMEFIDGQELDAYRISRGGKLAPADLVTIASQILSGLDYLHGKDMVHRDIKPQNIMISTSREVKLMDYGIATSIRDQLTNQNNETAGVGTLLYMAPEQLRGEICDRRADLYSVGIMLYQLLVGEFPFTTRSREDVVAWHVGPEFTGSSLHGNWQEFFRRILARKPSARYATCGEVSQALVALSDVPLSNTGKTRASGNTGPRPPLPRTDEDQEYQDYLQRKTSIFTNFDPESLKGPLPRTPQTLVREAQRILMLPTFRSRLPQILGGGGGFSDFAISAHTRFKLCLDGLERWAFFYPQFRRDFIDLRNQADAVLEWGTIDTSYFKNPELIQKHAYDGSVAPSPGIAREERSLASRSPETTGPRSQQEVSERVGAGIPRAEASSSAGGSVQRNRTSPTARRTSRQGLGEETPHLAGAEKSRVTAGLLAVFLGAFGMHNFYLGFSKKGMAQLLLSLVTCGLGALITWPWAWIEASMIFSGQIRVDSQGVPLK